MKIRTIIIGAAAVILGAGFLIGAAENDDSRITSQSVIDDAGTAKVVGMSDCQDGSVILTIDGVPFDVTVRNGLFGAWVEYENGKPVAVADARD